MPHVYQVTKEVVENSSLEHADIGKWFYLVQGCYQLFETKQAAIESRNYVFGK